MKKPLIVYLPPELHEEIKKRSKDLFLPMTGWVIQAILEKIARENKTK